MLPRLAYPKLQQHCSREGLDFQVVDMRWGVTDDVINDHQVSQLCINEIVTCQQISCGPNFVVRVYLSFSIFLHKLYTESLHKLKCENIFLN